MSLPGKRIVQSTFDEVVRENIEDLELEPQEAVADAIEQFKAQGIELNNIVTDLEITDDGSSWHPVVRFAEKLCSHDKENFDSAAIKALLDKIQTECDKSLAHRVLAAKSTPLFATLIAFAKSVSGNADLSVTVLQTLSSFINGQPDLVTADAMKLFLEISESESPLLCLYAVRLIKLSCVMHEENRQTFVASGLVPQLASILTAHKDNCDIIKEVCQAFRSLTLDDDPRVPFCKAHDHAKMIVLEAEALELLLDIAKSYDDDVVLAEIFATLGKLAVRNEFCQRIVDLGGLDLMLIVLHNNVKNKVIVTNIIGVLKVIAGNDDVKVAVTKSDAPGIIVEAMDHHQQSEALCANSCACLATISLRNPHNVKRIMECHGHTAVLQCMKVHPNSTKVQKQACLAIRNLIARARENCDAILALGAEELVNQAMYVPECRDEAKAALRDLGCKVELTERWKGEKGEILKRD